MNPIKQNAIKLLELMVKSGTDNFRNSWFQDQSGLSPQDINDAIFYLKKNDAIRVLRAMGAAPFNFAAVILNSNGRYLYHEWQQHDNLVSSSIENGKEPMDKRKVFVVHGRNIAIRDDIFQFLRAIKLDPIEWNQAIIMTGKPAPFVGEVLEVAFSNAQAVVVLLTGDDEVRLRSQLISKSDSDYAYESKLMPQARPNVLFEAGMALGRHPERTVLVEIGHVKKFSDIGGRHVIRLDNSSSKRQELAQRLEISGCSVNLSGTDWHTVGNFEAENILAIAKELENQSKNKSMVNDDEISILKLIATAYEEGQDAIYEDTIASILKLSKIKIRHYLDELLNKDYIEKSHDLDFVTIYSLQSKGRAFLIQRGLI